MKEHMDRLKNAIACYDMLLRWYFMLTRELAGHANAQINKCNAIIQEFRERDPVNMEAAMDLVTTAPGSKLWERATEFQTKFNEKHQGEVKLKLPLKIELDGKNSVMFVNNGGTPDKLEGDNAALVLDEAYKMLSGTYDAVVAAA